MTDQHRKQDALDSLNEALDAAEARLYKLNPDGGSEVQLNVGVFLAWAELHGKWGLCIVTRPALAPISCSPLQSASSAHRISAAYHLEKLLEAILAKLALDKVAIANAITAANAFVEGELSCRSYPRHAQGVKCPLCVDV